MSSLIKKNDSQQIFRGIRGDGTTGYSVTDFDQIMEKEIKLNDVRKKTVPH